jgi:hypothetical protein
MVHEDRENDDDRQWHAEKPEQSAASKSHSRLLLCFSKHNARSNGLFPCGFDRSRDDARAAATGTFDIERH